MQIAQSSVASTAQEEHNRVFHRRSGLVSLGQGRRTARTSGSSGRKRPRKWSHKFICLASNVVTRWISTDRYDLEVAGLGEREIEFEDVENTDCKDFTVRLEEEYPKLETGGGYELMRLPPNSRNLEVIRPPTEGYTPVSTQGDGQCHNVHQTYITGIEYNSTKQV